MTLDELARLALTKGDEYRMATAEQRKKREAEAKKAAEVSCLRRQARLGQSLRSSPFYGTAGRERKRENVVAVTMPSPRKQAGSVGSDRTC